MFPVCRELGIGFVPFSPLGRGFLSGTVGNPETLDANDVRRRLPRFQPENFSQNLALVQRVKEKASAKRCTPSQLALAWLLRQPAVTSVVAGALARGDLVITSDPGDLQNIAAALGKSIRVHRI